MSEKEFDLDKEVEKLSRKSNIDMRKTEFAFENQIRKLDKDIDNIVKSKIKEFDENKELTSEYLSTDYSSSTIGQYKKKLKKI